MANSKWPGLRPGHLLFTLRDITYVDVVGRYSKPRYPEKTLEELNHLVTLTSGNQEAAPISHDVEVRNVSRRLGPERMDQLVADYKSGLPTTELMHSYGLSKTSVLTVLAKNHTPMRRQPLRGDQLKRASELYSNGSSLLAVAAEIGVPRETVRRSLVEAGVPMRSRGGSKRKS